MSIFEVKWTLEGMFADMVEFNWFEKYHHILAIIILGILILLFALTLKKNSYTVRYINYISFASLIVLLIVTPINNINIVHTLWFNDDSLYLTFYLIGGTFIALTLLNVSDLSFIKENKEIEFPMLVIMGFLATALLIGSTNLISVFIALECLAFLSYVLVAFERTNKLSAQAGVRYLFLGAVPTGLFVLGVVELYSFLGTFNLDDAEKLIYGSNEMSRLHHFIMTESEANLNHFLFDYSVEACHDMEFRSTVLGGTEAGGWHMYMGRINDRLYFPNEVTPEQAKWPPLYQHGILRASASPEVVTDEIVMHELNDVLPYFSDHIKEQPGKLSYHLGNIITYEDNPKAATSRYEHFGNHWLLELANAKNDSGRLSFSYKFKNYN